MKPRSQGVWFQIGASPRLLGSRLKCLVTVLTSEIFPEREAAPGSKKSWGSPYNQYLEDKGYETFPVYRSQS